MASSPRAMSMRVALFVSSLRGGGAERAMLELARGLSQRGLVVDLVLVKATGPYLELVPPDIRIIDLDSGKAVVCFPRFVRYLRRWQPAVVISSMPTQNIIAIIGRMFGVRRTAIVARRESTFTLQLRHSGFKLRIKLMLERILLRFADAVVTISRMSSDDLVQAAPQLAPQIRLIHNPVVRPDLAKQAKEAVDHPWFRDSSTPLVLAVGRLVPVKDYPTLLKAFANVVLKSRPAKLVILGDGPAQEDLLRLCKDLGAAETVDFPGFVVNPYAYMSRASAFVLSSLFEGLPTVLIEAMACGTPIVSTDCPSGPREILLDGALGRLVPVGDWRALGLAILETLDNPIEFVRLVEGANRYSAESSIKQHFDLVSELAQRVSQEDRKFKVSKCVLESESGAFPLLQSGRRERHQGLRRYPN